MNKAMFSVFVLCFMGVALAGTTVLSTILIKNETYYSPYPAEPGKYFDLYVSIRNVGSEPVSILCRLDNKYPFAIDSSEDPVRVFADFGENREALIKYRVRVDETAVEGDNNLDFTCTDTVRRTDTTKTFKIYVQAKASTVNVEAVSVTPSSIIPGQHGMISITVKSESPNYLKDFRIRIDPAVDAPFAVVNGTNEKMVSSVDPYQSVTVPFELVAYPSAIAGVYRIPISVTYSDKLGKAYSIAQTTGIIVASDPRIELSAESTELSTPDNSGKVVLRVMNRGLSNVKLLAVRLLPSPDQYVILSAPTQYVGTVNSDDFETAEFRIYIFPNASKQLALLSEVSYSDSSNNAYLRAFAPTLTLFDSAEALQYGLEKKQDNTVTYAIIALLGLFVLFKYVLPPLSRFVSSRLSRQHGKGD